MSRQGANRADRLILLLIVIVFLAGGVVFAFAQNVWVDETTQLSGMTLPPGRLLAWLMGTPEPSFGVPPDRMPPLGYLFDGVFWRAWGNDVLAFRLLHLGIAALGLGVLLDAVRGRLGLGAMIVTGLLLALLPKLIDTVVEIRSYTMLFALSCMQVAMILRSEDRSGWRWIGAFAALGLVSSYTHFFGVVATSAFFVALFVASASRAGAVRVAVVYAVLLLSWSGLVPFVFGAATASAAPEGADMRVSGLAAYLLKLIGHSANLVSWPGAALLFAGAIGLFVLMLAGLAVRARREGVGIRTDRLAILFVALVAGLAATLAAGLVVSGFNPMKPNYSIWMLPVIAVLVGGAFRSDPARGSGLLRVVRYGAAALMLAGAAWGQVDFLRRADGFAHGPEREIARALAVAGPHTAVVYAGPSWGFGYYPLYWRQREALDQWLLSDDGATVHRISRGGDPTTPAQPLGVLDGYRSIIVARIEQRDYRAFRDMPAGSPVEAAPIVDQGFPGGQWTAEPASATPGLFWLTIQSLHRRPGVPHEINPG